MADTQNTGSVDPGAIKDPEEWTTGNEPATPAQKSYIQTLEQRSNTTMDADVEEMTKAEASMKIDQLRQEAGITDAG